MHKRDRQTSRRAVTAVPPEACTAATLFDELWTSLVDILGPTAAAAVITRSVKSAASRQAGLEHPVIVREKFAYHHRTPASWSAANDRGLSALRAVVTELFPLLTELTGPVVVRRLREVKNLERCGILPKDVSL